MYLIITIRSLYDRLNHVLIFLAFKKQHVFVPVKIAWDNKAVPHHERVAVVLFIPYYILYLQCDATFPCQIVKVRDKLKLTLCALFNFYASHSRPKF